MGTIYIKQKEAEENVQKPYWLVEFEKLSEKVEKLEKEIEELKKSRLKLAERFETEQRNK